LKEKWESEEKEGRGISNIVIPVVVIVTIVGVAAFLLLQGKEEEVLPGPTAFVVYSDAGLGQGVGDPAWYDGGDGSTNAPPWTIDQSEVGEGCLGDSSHSWKVQYTNGSGYWGGFYVQFSSAEDMSAYSNLTFYIKGESGNEKFKISIRDSSTAGGSEPTVPIGNYTTVTTSWQKVTIPLSAFTGQNTSSIDIPFNITFSDDYTAGNVTVYIDLVKWE